MRADTLAENDAVIVDAIRTPIGRKGGALKDVRADDLGAAMLRALIARNALDPAALDDVICGTVTQTGEQGVNLARMTALAAGLPVSVSGLSVNRLCGSSLSAVSLGAMAVSSGHQDVVACLGVESMSRVPMGSDVGPMNPVVAERHGLVPQGEAAELIVDRYGFTRDEMDALALESHRRAVQASTDGRFAREIVPCFGLEHDETPRRDTTREKLASLAPAFRADGRITAATSSQIADGAAGVLMARADVARARGWRPRARIRAMAVVGVDPTIMLTGPAPATVKALAKAGLRLDDIDVIECNEAFASVPLAFARELGIDVERLNPRGGAMALGHPLGATGARLVTSLLHTLEDEDETLGLATLCIGFGQGIAVIVERV